MTAATHTALVLVTVGTDHHPFPRVISWAQQSVGELGRHAELICQHGTAPPPPGHGHAAFFPYDQLRALMARADAIVTHGGPSTVLEVLRSGRVPIVVPRLRRHGEAVDDHQVDFARFMLERGLIAVADSAVELACALQGALRSDRDDERVRTSAVGAVPVPADSIAEFAALARELVPPRRARLLRRRPPGADVVRDLHVVTWR